MDFDALMQRKPKDRLLNFDQGLRFSLPDRGVLIQLTSGIAGNIQPNPATT
jgi:hypothetical protein